MPGNNNNVIRTVVGGGAGPASISNYSRTEGGTNPTVFRAVVIKYFHDTFALTEQEKTELRNRVDNPTLVDVMPNGSVLGTIITNNDNLSLNRNTILFPFFSSHFQQPIAVGEQVGVIYEDFARQGTQVGRWIGRLCETLQVEDLNYTHGDRRYDLSLIQLPPSNQQQQQQSSSTAPNTPVGFPNGGGTVSTFSLPPSGSVNPFDALVRENGTLATPEPVPQFVRKPQEFLLQGMNNSLLYLGEDRPEGTPTKTTNNYTGTCAIVCGRGRQAIPYTETTQTPTNTNPNVTRNSRRTLENDHAAFKRNQGIRRNPNEGHLSYKDDASIFYMSMNTLADRNFRLQHSTDSNTGFQYPENTLRPTSKEQTPGGIGNAYGVLKSDNLRFVARKDTDREINGTILLLKEGTANQDLAYVYLDEQGRIQTEAKEIYLGQATEKSNPYIKWTVYEEHITKLKDEIKRLADEVKTLSQALQRTFTLANTAAIPTPSAGVFSGIQANIVQAAIQVSTTSETVKTNVDTINPADAKSTKIFGG